MMYYSNYTAVLTFSLFLLYIYRLVSHLACLEKCSYPTTRRLMTAIEDGRRRDGNSSRKRWWLTIPLLSDEVSKSCAILVC